MSTEEGLKLVGDSKTFLEPYRIYGQMIVDGITQLDNLEKLIRGNSLDEAYKLSVAMCEQIAGYKSFVPKLADNLEKVRDILKNAQ